MRDVQAYLVHDELRSSAIEDLAAECDVLKTNEESVRKPCHS